LEGDRIVKELSFVSATKLAEMIRNREVTPVEVVDHYLGRIDSINPSINAFCTVVAEQAREEAKRAEKKVISGEKLGPLHGVPVAIKDLTPTQGILTTFGSLLFKDFVPRRDAIVVRRIKEAGAIILGKTNTPEFGHKGTTDNLLFGTTKNPWNPEMTSGGSSGGSAAAVAAGLVPLAEGSDGGGSIRIPASFCGVFGFKPSYGRIPYDSNPRNMFASQNPFQHYGPLARSVEDAALLFSVMTGFDPADPFSLPDLGEDFLKDMKNDVRPLRVAYSPDLGIYEVDSRVGQAMEKAVETLRRLGLQVAEVEFKPGEKDAFERAFEVLWFTQYASSWSSVLPEKREMLSRAVVNMIEVGQTISALEYKQVEVLRTGLYYKIRNLFADFDLLICPTLATPAFSHQIKGPAEINGKRINPFTDWMMTNLFNLTGHPAASVPIGFTEDGLPIGMQVIGSRLEDSKVLRLSYAYQQTSPWADRHPNP